MSAVLKAIGLGVLALAGVALTLGQGLFLIFRVGQGDTLTGWIAVVTVPVALLLVITGVTLVAFIGYAIDKAEQD